MKHGFLKVAMAAPQVRVADCIYNGQQTLTCIRKAAEQGVKLLVLPELGLTGYTCGDLFLQKTLLNGAEQALTDLLQETAELETVFVVGLPVAWEGRLYNCAAVCAKGEILGLVPKTHLANYGEYCESRYFAKKADLSEITLCGRLVKFGAEQVFRCVEMPECVIYKIASATSAGKSKYCRMNLRLRKNDDRIQSVCQNTLKSPFRARRK